MFRCSIMSAFTAVMAIGVSCSFSVRNSAVTTTSWSASEGAAADWSAVAAV